MLFVFVVAFDIYCLGSTAFVLQVAVEPFVDRSFESDHLRSVMRKTTSQKPKLTKKIGFLKFWKSCRKYVLNVARRADRRELMRRQLGEWKAKRIIFWKGIDGQSLKSQNGKVMKVTKSTYELSWEDNTTFTLLSHRVRINGQFAATTCPWGQLGCSLSHQKALEHASARFAGRQDCVCVFEDDIKKNYKFKYLDTYLQCKLDAIVSRYPDWKLLMLGGTKVNKWAKATKNMATPLNGVCFAEHVMQSHAYIVRKAVVPFIIDKLKEGFASDNALVAIQRANVGHCFLLSPVFFVQQRKMLGSDIAGARGKSVVDKATTNTRSHVAGAQYTVNERPCRGALGTTGTTKKRLRERGGAMHAGNGSNAVAIKKKEKWMLGYLDDNGDWPTASASEKHGLSRNLWTRIKRENTKKAKAR